MDSFKMTAEMSVKKERRLTDFRDRSVWHDHAMPLPLQNRNETSIGKVPFVGVGEAENLRHFCKICKRRFACGRALGGHMRIHGAAAAADKSKAKLSRVQDNVVSEGEMNRRSQSESESVQDEDEDEEQKQDHQSETAPHGTHPTSNKKNDGPFYALRTNRKRSWLFADKSYSFLSPDATSGSVGAADRSPLFSNPRACDECGKEFSSWKAMLAHMKCSHLNKAEEIPEMDSQSNGDDDTHILQPATHVKGKRSKRLRCSELLAQQQLSTSHSHSHSPATSVSQYNEEEEMANCLVMLATAGKSRSPSSSGGPRKLGSFASELARRAPPSGSYDEQLNKTRSYKCKTCEKVFSSFQALGGHRASHKNFTGCSASKNENESSEEEEIITTDEDLFRAEAQTDYLHKPPRSSQNARLVLFDKWNGEESDENLCATKARVHECSICHRKFSSGQALGGHKRCHWTTTSADAAAPAPAPAPATATTATAVSSCTLLQQTIPEETTLHRHRGELLDLNLPAPADDDVEADYVAAENYAAPNNLVKNFLESRAETNYCKSFPCYIQPWWSGNSQNSRLFSCNEQTQTHFVVGPDDEAESNQKGFG